MRAIFKNLELQQHFDKNGYVKITTLNAVEAEELKSYYLNTRFDNKIEHGFHISLDNLNQDLVRDVGQKIRSVLEPKMDAVFDRCKVFTASYVIKEPGLKNIVPPHQDWTFVDEKDFFSMTVWTALVDVTEDNGALGVIPGSHRLFTHVRSSPSPQSKSPLADHVFTLFPYVEIVEMKAGETLIFDNRLIHASPPNLSDEPRIAVGIGVTQEEAQLLHFYHVPGSEPVMLERFEVDEDFFTWYNNARLSDFYERGVLPDGLKSTGRVPRVVPDYSAEEMKAHVESLPDVRVNQPLMDKLARLFNYNPEAAGAKKEEHTRAETKEVVEDNRTFFQKYTPANIAREIALRMNGRKERV